MEESKSSIGHDVRSFMENAQKKYGENTVIYVSLKIMRQCNWLKNATDSLNQVAFGTVFWTSQPEKLWAIVDVMLDLGIPFVSIFKIPHNIF